MLEIPKGQTTDSERAILRKLRVWIAALAVACLVAGVGIGAMLSGKPTTAQQQSEAQIARAPEALSASFAEIARRVEPAVVNIDTISAPPTAARGKAEESEEDEELPQGLPPGHPLLDMFRQRQRRPSRGVGSGFIVDPKGLILTNQHVVEGATRINVKLQSGELLRGDVVGIDAETDLAVIKVNTSRDLPAVKLGNSNEVQVGDWVLAVGSPFGLEQTVTAGIISTKERRTPGSGNFQQFLQTDAAINRGNSGGPLVNMRGEVIGVNSQIATSTGDYNGIGFALPANEANFVYRQIVAAGKVQRGYLGVYLQPVKSEFARVYGLSEAKGAIVGDVVDADSPAGKAGLQINDIITDFNGQPVTNSQDLINKVAGTPVGQSVQVGYMRDVGGKLEPRSTSVRIGERPPRSTVSVLGGEPSKPTTEEKPKKDAPTATIRPVLGMTLSELTTQLANERKLSGVRGLLVKDVDESGLAYEAGLAENMVIQRVNRTPVTTLAEFERVVNALKPGDPVVMHVVVWDERNSRLVQSLVQFTYQ
ncbi:MAG TPA: Do family serine endopeptidase [Pyrinomonadaceae bacterium]|jgi:serine protease Do